MNATGTVLVLLTFFSALFPESHAWKESPTSESCAQWCRYDIKNCELPFKRDQCQGCAPCQEMKKANALRDTIAAACPPCPKITPPSSKCERTSAPPPPCPCSDSDAAKVRRERDNLRGWLAGVRQERDKSRDERDALRLEIQHCRPSNMTTSPLSTSFSHGARPGHDVFNSMMLLQDLIKQQPQALSAVATSSFALGVATCLALQCMLRMQRRWGMMRRRRARQVGSAIDVGCARARQQCQQGEASVLLSQPEQTINMD